MMYPSTLPFNPMTPQRKRRMRGQNALGPQVTASNTALAYPLLAQQGAFTPNTPQSAAGSAFGPMGGQNFARPKPSMFSGRRS